MLDYVLHYSALSSILCSIFESADCCSIAESVYGIVFARNCSIMLRVSIDMNGQTLIGHRPAERIRFLALGAPGSPNYQPGQDGIKHGNAGGHPKQQSEAVHRIPQRYVY